ncbi:hypothetical protein AbraIFM66950_004721 [Aspergillus brasiliensis]|nr:hypothetical protein AbraIFM66950_004721 [Aspergillus brasiliensis]
MATLSLTQSCLEESAFGDMGEVITWRRVTWVTPVTLVTLAQLRKGDETESGEPRQIWKTEKGPITRSSPGCIISSIRVSISDTLSIARCHDADPSGCVSIPSQDFQHGVCDTRRQHNLALDCISANQVKVVFSRAGIGLSPVEEYSVPIAGMASFCATSAHGPALVAFDFSSTAGPAAKYVPKHKFATWGRKTKPFECARFLDGRLPKPPGLTLGTGTATHGLKSMDRGIAPGVNGTTGKADSISVDQLGNALVSSTYQMSHCLSRGPPGVEKVDSGLSTYDEISEMLTSMIQ